MGLAAAREQIGRWLADPTIRGLVVDTDSDGLLSAIYLQDARQQRFPELPSWPVAGGYDMERLWLAEPVDAPSWLDHVILVDVDARTPGARVISQHVITDARRRWDILGEVPAGIQLLNPNYDLVEEGARQPYRSKYPFSTAAWVALLLDHQPLDPQVDADHWALLLAQDSSLRNGIGLDVPPGRYWANCRTWACDVMATGTLATTYRGVADAHQQCVANAARQLQQRYRDAMAGLVPTLPENDATRVYKEQWSMDLPSHRRSGLPATLRDVLRSLCRVTASRWFDGRLANDTWRSRLPRHTRRQRLRLAADTAPQREPFTLARTSADHVKMTVHSPTWD